MSPKLLSERTAKSQVFFVMSDSKTSPTGDANKTVKRNLPSWMSSRENAAKSPGKKPTEDDVDEDSREGGEPRKAKGHGRVLTGSSPSKENKTGKKSAAPSSSTAGFSKFLEGVVFVLSGFVNPERSTLRSQALTLGAEYQPDWNSDCTLLICAFPNTPKFRQVQSDCGTIVSKEWISECYNQKKLVDIESYLMHAGKPWRKSNISHEANHDEEKQPPTKPHKQVEKESHIKPTASSSKFKQSGASSPAKDHFPPAKVKKWVIDDFNKTLSWLESQEEKPEPSEINTVAAQGVLTCLQDALVSLERKEDIRQATEQWGVIPKVVEELIKLDGSESNNSKEGLYKQAMACKRIYEAELERIESDSSRKNKKLKTGESEVKTSDDVAGGYDSDQTIEMSQEEIDLAYKNIVSKACK